MNADVFDDVLKMIFLILFGVFILHHTKDPYGAFKILAKSLKKMVMF